MRNVIGAVVLMAVALGAAACKSPYGATAAEKRASVSMMRDRALQELYQQKPDSKAQIAAAPGYAVFSNMSAQVFLFGGGNGYGVVHENDTGIDNFMRMGEAGLGLGLGVSDFRLVFVFHDKPTLHKFVAEGFEFGGAADAAAKVEDTGGGVGAKASTDGDITIYQLTDTGIALMASVRGTKYWLDEELNRR